jgi:hypothetical protein
MTSPADGYAIFKDTQGSPIAINASNVSYVQAFTEQGYCRICFEKDHSIVVASDNLTFVVDALQKANRN